MVVHFEFSGFKKSLPKFFRNIDMVYNNFNMFLMDFYKPFFNDGIVDKLFSQS